MARLTLLVCVGVLLPLTRPPGHAPDQRLSASTPTDQASASLLQIWTKAVWEHEPGTADAAALTIEKWSSENVQEVIHLVVRIEKALASSAAAGAKTGREEPFVYDGHLYTPRQFRAFLQIPEDAAVLTDPNQLLRHGAMLHTDIAMLVPVAPNFANRPLPSQGSSTAVLILDGQVLALESDSVHWQHARALLDATTPEPGQDEFARQWYLATSAWQANRLRWSDSTVHLRHARDLFPSDSRIFFYSGVMSEAIAGPAIQAAREAAKRTGLSPTVESKQDSLETALAFLRRAVALEPGFSEGHLHLGRVLALLGRHDEAVRELTDALSGLTDDELRYDAQLFLGGEQEIQGQLASARDNCARAAAAFSTAQSPLFALSRIARLTGDVSGAAAAFDRLQSLTGRPDRFDPWWRYDNAHARNAEELMRSVRSLLKADERR